VFLDFATSSGCEGGRKPAVRYRRLIFTLPRGGTVRAGAVSISEVCGLSISQFGLPERYAQPRARSGTAGTLLARIRLPSRVRAGSALRYSITLSNPTRRTVVLRPCPGYTQGLYTTAAIVHRSYRLNCDTVHDIRAHQRVRYALRLLVPGRAGPGIAKIGWNVNTPTGPFAGSAVRISTR
jgi:hypothetical protein